MATENEKETKKGHTATDELTPEERIALLRKIFGKANVTFSLPDRRAFEKTSKSETKTE